jgi:hypothetical protein
MALRSSASLSIRGLRDCFFLGGGADEEVPSVAAGSSDLPLTSVSSLHSQAVRTTVHGSNTVQVYVQ